MKLHSLPLFGLIILAAALIGCHGYTDGAEEVSERPDS
jgi:hypothetical protein